MRHHRHCATTWTILRHRAVRLATAATLAVFAGPAVAQWSVESPIPTHLTVGGLGAPTVDRLFLGTADDPFDDGGALFESNDGGVTWIQRDVPFSLGDGVGGVFFLDDQRGWLWGNVNYRTLDGGTTWEELPFLGSAYFMEFYTPTFGLTTGNFDAFVSLDGGLTWTPPPHDMRSFSFADGLVGVGTADTGLYQTIDGGVTFSLVHAGAADAVVFLTATDAVAIVDGGFARSTDGGATWTAGADAEGRHRLVAVSASVALAWGRSGTHPDYDDRIFRTDDAGATWTDLGVPIEPGPFDGTYRFAVPTATTVIAANGPGDVYRSTDAGATWARTFVTPAPPIGNANNSAPVFPDPLVGYYAYGHGYVIATTDGGATWTQISSGTGTSLEAMDRFADGTLIVVGDDGEVARRSAGTTTWTILPAPTTADLEAVQVLGPQDVVTVSRDGIVHRSADAGETWTSGTTSPPVFTAEDLHFTTPLDGWVTGGGFSGAALFHTADGGDSWTPVTDFQGAYVAIDFEGAHGWAANRNGIFYTTTDGGATWALGTLPSAPSTIRDMEFWNTSIGYAVGTTGYAARTDDGGATWQILPTPDATQQLTDVTLLGPDELWASTAEGTALYSATGGTHWAAMDAGEAGFGAFYAIAATPTGDAWMAGSQGHIRKFSGPPPPPVNQPPVANFAFTSPGMTIDFTDQSVDPDGTIVAWSWDFDDGTTSTEQNPTHTFPAEDTYLVTLTVTDDDGDTDSRWRAVVAQDGPGGVFGDFVEVTPLDPLFVTPQDEDFWVTSAATADYDGDGDLDIAVLGFYVVYNVSAVDMLVLLRNDGAVNPEEWEIAYTEVPLGTVSSGASDLAWGDADGDGDQDLVVGSNNQTVIYRNDAGELVQTTTELPGYWEDNSQADFDLASISFADYDNDGDLDLLLPSVWDQPTFSFRTVLLRNDGLGGGGDWTFTKVPTAIAATSHAQSFWADDDGDQDLDLLLVNLVPNSDDGFVRRYRNDGNGVFVGEDLLDGLTVEHGEVQWGDADDDGDLDILVAGHVKEPDGTYAVVLRIYRNDGTGYTPEDVLECLGCEGWIDITAAWWADYDSDGDVDILLAGNYNSGSQIDGRAKIYDNDGGVYADSGNQLPAPRSSGSRGGSFSWLDLDTDGDLDYFIAGQYFVPGGNGLVEAQMHLYVNEAPGTNGAPSAPWLLESFVLPDGSVSVWWNAATDDLTPSQALTYDLQLFLDGDPVATPRRLPEPGIVSGATEWILTDLPEGAYRWVLRAVDSAYNDGPAAEGTFTIGTPPAALIFGDGFESGDLSAWSVVVP